MFKTIKSRFVAITVFFIILSVGIPTGFLVYQYRANFKQRSEIMLETTLSVIKNCINQTMLEEDKNIQHVLSHFANNEHIKHIRILDKNGTIEYSSNPDESSKNIMDISPNHVHPSVVNKQMIRILREDKVYFALEPIKNSPECRKCHLNDDTIAYLDIDADLSRAEVGFYTGSKHIIYLAITLIIILFSGFIIFFNVFINKPLSKVIYALNQVEGGDLDTRIPVKHYNEFGVLGRQFNSMVEKLKSNKKEIEDLHFEQLQRADKLVTLGELAAEMAHEINNPTAVIMSRSDYLQMEMEDNPQMQKYGEDIEVILNQVSKISKITGSILKYGKKRPKDFTNINIESIIQDALNILEPRIHKKNVNIHFDKSEKEFLIYGDSIQCEQVITNLLNNAIDAIKEEGNIWISLQEENDGALILVVRDDGEGMDEHTRKQIFNPFYTTKSADKGTGLGLYIVKNICQNHQAEISCTSKINEGTTFTIQFHKT